MILVLGSNGFLGRHFLDGLHKRGAEVKCIATREELDAIVIEDLLDVTHIIDCIDNYVHDNDDKSLVESIKSQHAIRSRIFIHLRNAYLHHVTYIGFTTTHAAPKTLIDVTDFIGPIDYPITRYGLAKRDWINVLQRSGINSCIFALGTLYGDYDSTDKITSRIFRHNNDDGDLIIDASGDTYKNICNVQLVVEYVLDNLDMAPEYSLINLNAPSNIMSFREFGNVCKKSIQFNDNRLPTPPTILKPNISFDEYCKSKL